MPILAFAKRAQDLLPTVDSVGRRTLIQVSQDARGRIDAMLDAQQRCCTPAHIEALRAMQGARSFDAEIGLLIDAIERDGEVYVRFL